MKSKVKVPCLSVVLVDVCLTVVDSVEGNKVVLDVVVVSTTLLLTLLPLTLMVLTTILLLNGLDEFLLISGLSDDLAALSG